MNLKYFFLSIFLFISQLLYGAPSDYKISVTGIFPQEETVYLTTGADTVIPVKLPSSREKQTVEFSIPYQKNSPLIWVKIHSSDGLLKCIHIEKVLVEDALLFDASGFIKAFNSEYSYNVKFEKKEIDKGIYCSIQKKDTAVNDCSFYFILPGSVYPSRPVGLRLFLLLSFLAALLLLFFILYRRTSSQHLLIIAIGIFLALLPLKIDYNTWSMAILALAVIISFIRNRSRSFRWQPIFYVLCSIYAFHLIGLSYTGSLDLGIRQLDTIIVLIGFPVLFGMFQLSKKDTVLILRFFVWTVIAFCCFGFLSYAAIVPEPTWNMVFRDSKLYASLLLMWPAHPHPSFVSTVLLMSVPIAFYLRFQEERHITVTELLLGIIFPIVITILSGARIGMIIAPCLLGLGYLFYCRFKPLLKWGIVGIAIAVLMVLLSGFPQADDRFVDPVRKDLRTIAVKAIKERPVFGWGTGCPKTLIQSEETLRYLNIETPYRLGSFHNQYLNAVVQFGIPGATVLLLLIGWLAYLAFRDKNFLLFSLLTIYLLFFWTETVLGSSKGVIPFTFWVCFIVSNRTGLFSGRRYNVPV